MRKLFQGACLFSCSVFFSTATLAGPIFLTGHDPDFHSQDNVGAQELLKTGLDFATSGTYDNGTDKFLWVESRIAPPGGHRIGELGLGTIGLTLGTHYDRANAAELAGINFSDYTAIVTASSFGGLFSRAELDALIGLSASINTFVNSGGGIFSMANCFPCGASLLAGATSPDLFGFLPIEVVSVATSGPYDPTAFGLSLGLEFGDLNSPTHNAFMDASGLNIVDIDRSNGLPVTLAGIVEIDDDGGFKPPSDVPEASSLLMLGLGLFGIGLTRLRKQSII